MKKLNYYLHGILDFAFQLLLSTILVSIIFLIIMAVFAVFKMVIFL